MDTRKMSFSPQDEQQIRILGSRVHLIDVARTVDYIEHWIQQDDGKCKQIIATGFHGLHEASKSGELRDLLNSAELWVADGIAPVWVARIKGIKQVQRAPGPEIMMEFLRRSNLKGYRNYFYGDTDRTLNALQAQIESQYPNSVIAGLYSPPFRKLTPEEDEEIVARINKARPDILWVGLGAPKQDRWIYERLHRLNVPVAIGVGAAFAFAAKTVDHCPRWIGNAGFEWVYRLYKEPKKMWRRDFIDGPSFLMKVGKELLFDEHPNL